MRQSSKHPKQIHDQDLLHASNMLYVGMKEMS